MAVRIIGYIHAIAGTGNAFRRVIYGFAYGNSGIVYGGHKYGRQAYPFADGRGV